MDINAPIEITDQNGKVTLPLANLLRLTVVYMRQFMEEYGQTHDKKGANEFLDWIKYEKLGVSRDGGKVLL